jgi:hypothetical protein
MRRVILTATALLFAAMPAIAAKRYNSEHLTTKQIDQVLKKQRSVIFRYPSRNNPTLVLFDLYVWDPFACKPGMDAEKVKIPARNGMASVFHCIEKTHDNNILQVLLQETSSTPVTSTSQEASTTPAVTTTEETPETTTTEETPETSTPVEEEPNPDMPPSGPIFDFPGGPSEPVLE